MAGYTFSGIFWLLIKVLEFNDVHSSYLYIFIIWYIRGFPPQLQILVGKAWQFKICVNFQKQLRKNLPNEITYSWFKKKLIKSTSISNSLCLSYKHIVKCKSSLKYIFTTKYKIMVFKIDIESYMYWRIVQEWISIKCTCSMLQITNVSEIHM